MKTYRTIAGGPLFFVPLVSLLLLTSALWAQKRSEYPLDVKYFQISSLVVDGREMTEFDLRFVIKGREVIPRRDGKTVFVPNDVDEVSWEDSAVRIVANNIDFTLNIKMKGYRDADPIKSDYNIRVDTIPLVIKLRHVSSLTKKEKRSLGIRSYKDVCAVYSLTSGNMVVSNPNMIVDPIITQQFALCKK